MEAAKISLSLEVERGQELIADPSLSVRPRSAIQMRMVTYSDYPSLTRFLAAFPGETRGEDFWLRRFNRWWDGNPAFDGGIARGWMLSENGDIRGFLGNVPTRVQLFGKPVVAFNTTTWRVLPSYRNHSLRLFYEAQRSAKNTIFFDTTPSEDAVRILKSLKFHLLPHSSPRRSFVIPNAERVLRSRISNKVSADVAAWLGAPALRVLQNYRLRLGKKSKRTDVRHLTRADSAFDELWLRTRHLYANTNVRLADIVNWQCFADQDFCKPLFGCFCGDLLVGYLIGSIGSRNGLKVFVCADVWLDPQAPNGLQELLRFSLRWAYENEVDLIEIPHYGSFLAQLLTSLRLHQRIAMDEQPSYYKIPESGILEPKASYFVGLQGDRGF